MSSSRPAFPGAWCAARSRAAATPCWSCTAGRDCSGRISGPCSTSSPPATAWRPTSSGGSPSDDCARAPYDVATQVGDAVAVLDALGWGRAHVVGHSSGGHLLLHLLAEHPGRVAGALIVDTLGGVGDGGEAEFDEEMLRRTPPGDVARVEQLERRAMEGRGTEADLQESMRLLWPAYFADPASAPPFPGLEFSLEAEPRRRSHRCTPSSRGWLPGSRGAPCRPVFVHGAGSPMPISASSDTALVMGPSATVELLAGAGHFPWSTSGRAAREPRPPRRAGG